MPLLASLASISSGAMVAEEEEEGRRSFRSAIREETSSRYSVTRNRMSDSVVTMLACIVHMGDKTGAAVEDAGGGEGRKTLTKSIIVNPEAGCGVKVPAAGGVNTWWVG